MDITPDSPGSPDQPDAPPPYLPPYPAAPSLPPPPPGMPVAPNGWQPLTGAMRPPWLPPALARPPLTAQLVIAATVQFIAAAVMFLSATAALLLSVSVNASIDLVTLGVPTILCVAHLACGMLALARRPFSAGVTWAGYVLLAVELLVFIAGTR